MTSEETTKTPIVNLKIIGLIMGVTVVFQIFNSLYGKNNGDLDLFQAINTFLVGVAAISSFLVSQKYWGSPVFGKAYFALGIGFTCFFVADMIWYYYTEILKQYPYPSIADVFYFAFYPFSIYHIMKNARSFKKSLGTNTKIWLSVLPLAVVISYIYLSIKTGSEPFDFFYGVIFVGIAAVALALVIFGFQVFRKSILGNTWGLLLAGFSLFTIADVWYYHLEVVDQFTDNNPVTCMYTCGLLLICYSLYLHKKVL